MRSAVRRSLQSLSKSCTFWQAFGLHECASEPFRTFSLAFPASSGFTTFWHQKVAPKVSAGHLRRDRTKAVSERSRKTPLVARSLRAFHPLSDLLPPPVQCGGCCALHATMVYSDVILLYSIQQASGLPDRTAKIADEATVIGKQGTATFYKR